MGPVPGRERETEESIVKSLLRTAVLTAVTLAFAAGAVGKVSAQAVPATKVGVVNVGLLFTQYYKAQILKKELDDELKPLKEQAEKIKKAMIEHDVWLKNPANAKQTAQIEISKKALIDG